MMRVILLIILLFTGSVYAQLVNYVPNGEFESGTYNGGSQPANYYSALTGQSSSSQRFDKDVDNWYTAKADKLYGGKRRDSPDWMDPSQFNDVEMGGNCTNSKYVRCAMPIENIMVKMTNGHKLIKGETYTFKIKARAGVGAVFESHNFQLIFTKDSKGLNTIKKNKWIAGDFYISNHCYWNYIEHTFTVPNDNEHLYEDMDHLVLAVNYYRKGIDVLGVYHDGEEVNDLKTVFNFDDVVLTKEPKCIDYRYIQDREYYNEHKIEQANVQISAGAYVSPYSWDANEPVIVKSNAKVIYRAPVVYLEPGFFVEEPGSYFEIQNGTCVEDPCPPITAYTPPITTICNGSVAMGDDITSVPGVFYVWEPSQHFSSPWSRETDFVPPTGSGCVDAKLTIWTICGDIKEYPFSMKYFDAAPAAGVNNVVSTPNLFEFDINITNASSYDVVAINTSNGQIIYQSQQDISCSAVNDGLAEHLKFSPCSYNMCDNIQVTVSAENDCFGSVTQTVNWIAPTPVAPVVNISNLVSNNLDYSFDLAIPATYEYFQIEVWNSSETLKLCTSKVTACDQPNLTSYHFDAGDCLSGCISNCKDYVIKITVKNNCYVDVATLTSIWNKSTIPFNPPSAYPNVITLNGDGINETLCFNVTGADYYDIWVFNQWQNTFLDETGCISENPLCLWTPPCNITDGTYFYIISFWNECGDYSTHQDFVQVFNDINCKNKTANSGVNVKEEIKEMIDSNFEVTNIYPNPTNGEFTLEFNNVEDVVSIKIIDLLGRTILTKTVNSNIETIDLSNEENGVYLVEITTPTDTQIEKVIKQ